MKNLYYISRNFVEFGALAVAEITDFKARGVLNDHDYVRAEKDHHWKPLAAWIKENTKATPAEKPVAKAKSPAPRKRAASPAKTPKKAA